MAFGKTSTVFVRTQSARAIAEIKTTIKLRFKKIEIQCEKVILHGISEGSIC